MSLGKKRSTVRSIKQVFGVCADKAMSESISKLIPGGRTQALMIDGVENIRISRDRNPLLGFIWSV